VSTVQQPVCCRTVPPRHEARSSIEGRKGRSDSSKADVVCATSLDAFDNPQRDAGDLSQLLLRHAFVVPNQSDDAPQSLVIRIHARSIAFATYRALIGLSSSQ
jgi:hypothetical protein